MPASHRHAWGRLPWLESAAAAETSIQRAASASVEAVPPAASLINACLPVVRPVACVAAAAVPVAAALMVATAALRCILGMLLLVAASAAPTDAGTVWPPPGWDGWKWHTPASAQRSHSLSSPALHQLDAPPLPLHPCHWRSCMLSRARNRLARPPALSHNRCLFYLHRAAQRGTARRSTTTHLFNTAKRQGGSAVVTSNLNQSQCRSSTTGLKLLTSQRYWSFRTKLSAASGGRCTQIGPPWPRHVHANPLLAIRRAD